MEPPFPVSRHPLEIQFPDADLPYLFVAALRRRLGDGALSSAVIIPSANGPAVILTKEVAGDPAVQELITLLEGSIVGDGVTAAGARGQGKTEQPGARSPARSS